MTDNDYFIEEPASAKLKYGVTGDATCRRLINFTTGDWQLKPQHLSGLSEVLGKMKARGDTAYIIGHASQQGHGTFDNKRLSDQRAGEVYKWFSSRIDTSANTFERIGEADTATIGTTSNDPKDRAVVLIVQSAAAPRPRILPPVEPPSPHQDPDGPLTPKIPWPFRMSGWEITSAWGTSLVVPTPLKNLSVGGSVLNIQLTQTRTQQTSTYRLIGTAASFGFDPLEKFSNLKGMLGKLWKNRPSPSGGPSSLPTKGSELVVTSWVPEPVTPSAFSHFAAISSINASAGYGSSGNVLVLSRVPVNVPIISEASIIAMGLFASAGFSFPGASADSFCGVMDLA